MVIPRYLAEATSSRACPCREYGKVILFFFLVMRRTLQFECAPYTNILRWPPLCKKMSLTMAAHCPNMALSEMQPYSSMYHRWAILNPGSWTFHHNPWTISMLLTNKQTTKHTNTGKNITSLAEGNNVNNTPTTSSGLLYIYIYRPEYIASDIRGVKISRISYHYCILK